jgi:NADP-dependent 3-hydroxy acid dehydrogenase YdfG
MLEPSGRVVMISGANRGIGRAVAERLAGRGYALSLGARRPDSLAELAGERIFTHAYDAVHLASAEDWVEDTFERFGRIDGLVNNAGILLEASLEDGDEAAFDRLWQVNVKSPLRLTRLALPHLKASGAGRVVNLVSLSGKRIKGDNAGYAMSKFAAMALSHATRRAGWDHGVRVCAVCPSFVATDMTTAARERVPGEAMIQPADLAELVATVLALPNTASVAELLVNYTFEDMV